MEANLIDVTIHPGTEGYGISFRGGSSPVLIESVRFDSSAENAGLKYGDFLLELNGNDIQSFSKDSVIAAIRSFNRGALMLRVGRVRPIPITAEDRMMAAQLLRNKLISEGERNSKEFVRYEETVKNSLLEVEDLLGSFDLPPIKKPLRQQTAPTTTTTTTTKKHTSSAVKGVNDFVEEVEVPLYDSDSLPSPPSSESSSVGDAQDMDQLLDFTRDDEFNYNPAFAKQEPEIATQEGMEGPRMLKATLQAKHGIEGMKELISEVNEAKETRRKQNNIPKVTTTATFAPTQSGKSGGGANSTQRSEVTRAMPTWKGGEDKSTQRSEVTGPTPTWSKGGADKSVQRSEATPTRSKGGADKSVQKSEVTAATPTWSKGGAESVQRSEVTGAAPKWSNKSGASKSTQRSPQHEVVESHQTVKAESRAASLTQHNTPPSLPVSTRRERTARDTPPLTSPRSLATPTSPTKPSIGTPARPHPLATSRQPVNPSVTKPAPITSLPQSRKGSGQTSPSPSPPVPPYNPAQPDRFLLSNKQDYRMEYWQQTHSYEPVDKAAVRQLQRNMEAAEGGVTTPLSPGRGGVASTPTSAEAAPFKRKRQGGLVATTSEEGTGYFVDEGDTSGGSGKLEIGRIQAKREAELADMAITDLSSVDACNGLPSNAYEWGDDEVSQWLYQLSPSLFKLYKANFVKHDIIGRSLIRLNLGKVKNMGITSDRHRRLLVMEVNRLKVRQEKMELLELQSEQQLSFL